MNPVDPDALAAAVAPWFDAYAEGVALPLELRRVGGGRSNLTYVVEDRAGRRWVLRRPPGGVLLPTAHDVVREARIMRALHGSAVPVPHVVGVAHAGEVLDVAFVVMGHVEGTVVEDADVAETLAAPVRATMAAGLVDALAELHAVDPRSVGLGDLGRPAGYVERQLDRWYRQWEATRDGRELPDLDAVHGWLAAHVPVGSAGEDRIVHGDYRLDNCIFGPHGRLRAVLDWELCTLGDPLVDVGLFVAYSSAPADGGPPVFRGPVLAGVGGLVARYGDRAGRDVADLAFYVAFAYWKLACIVQGVQRRYAAGDMGVGAPVPEDRVARLAALARRAAESLR